MKPPAPTTHEALLGRACSEDGKRDHQSRDQVGESESTQNTSKRKWILFANRRRKGGGGSGERQAESQGPEKGSKFQKTLI